jgi:YesN/AraC family two-component response regulator
VSECGYDSESFFKKYFKLRTGLSMKDWRAKNRE